MELGAPAPKGLYTYIVRGRFSVRCVSIGILIPAVYGCIKNRNDPRDFTIIVCIGNVYRGVNDHEKKIIEFYTDVVDEKEKKKDEKYAYIPISFYPSYSFEGFQNIHPSSLIFHIFTIFAVSLSCTRDTHRSII